MFRLIGFVAIVAFAGVIQPAIGCKKCAAGMTKEQRTMFRTHSNSCLAQSHVDPQLVESLLHGETVEDDTLKSHIYCTLQKCKIISKDGKPLKSIMIALRFDNKNVTKILESCSQSNGETPEEIAWNLFRCSYEKKAFLFNLMPTQDTKEDTESNLN